jgi:hypothetical protein
MNASETTSVSTTPDEPLQSATSRAILEGRALVTVLWQNPLDASTRARVKQILSAIKHDYAEQPSPRVRLTCQEMLVALRATPSPQQIDLLENGFNTLYRLWNEGGQRDKRRLSVCA